ncbi:hypothetical protein HPB47_020970 [Ixodes persulcatus]|uniref:Uncharacterized protein n=1 Tax=Ixodes persulcatus TaxID=34615 RepID=A0AC60QGB0_IXOPE|nr:hypothetical protein HPB47_020970 [Ixodes persulcatus]
MADSRRLLKSNAVPSIPALGNAQKVPRSKVLKKRSNGQLQATTARQRTTFPEVMSEECIPVELLTVEVEMPASPEPTRILEELLPALKSKLETMRPQEKHCALLLDEMQVTAGLDFDPTAKKPFGLVTIPPAKPGCSRDSIDGTFLKDLVFSVIRKCEDAGCYVDAVISDMGPSNKELWKKCGISAKQSATPVVSCNHPCAADTDRQLCFLADAPHVLKNIKGHLVRGQSIFLPDDIVAKYGLPTNEVAVVHIKALAEVDAALPHLKTSYLDPSHFEKMNVSSAVAVLNHSVGAAIRVLVCLGQLPSEALTTAWFVEQVFWWFSLMTSRGISMAMSLFKPGSHDQEVAFLEEFVGMFSRLSIRKKKPGSVFQAHALENLFSYVRSRNPVPRTLEFKLTLRLIMLSQFFKPSRKGSYAIDDSADLLEFIEIKKAASKKNTDAADEFFFEDSFLEDGAPDIDDMETESLVYLSGYITNSTDPVDHSDSLLSLKSYRSQSQPNPLVRPSRHVFNLLQHADKVFRSCEH